MGRRYLIIIERAGANYSAFAPDIPGCVATGHTIAETERLMREAIEFHFEGLVEEGQPIPEPSALTGYVTLEDTAANRAIIRGRRKKTSLASAAR